MSTRSRRQQNRLQGSGRVTTRRPFKLSRVNQFAIKVPKRRKDTEDEFENVDQFFQDSSAASTPGSALTAGSPASSGNEATTAGRGGRRRSTSGKKKSTTKPRRTPTPRTASPKKRLSFAGSRRESVATPGDFDASEDGGQFSDDGIEFDSGGDQQSDEGEEPTPEPTPKPKASKGGRRKAAKAKKVSLATPDARSSRPGRKRKTPVPRTFTTPDANLLDNSVVEDAPDNLQPLEPDPPTPGVRRSKRVRYKPLAHWKNERITTTVTHTASGGIALKTKAQRDGVPTPVIKRARNQGGASTPFAKRNELKRKQPGRKTAAKQKAAAKGGKKEKPLPPVKLPKGFEESEMEVVPILVEQSNGTELNENMRVIKRSGSVEYVALPQENDEPSGMACGTFAREEFLSGLLKLDPGVRKGSEDVHGCNQLFHVLQAQDKSLQLTLNRQHQFLLSAGDQFFVPAKCTYSLKNHSSAVTAEMNFVVVKPPPPR